MKCDNQDMNFNCAVKMWKFKIDIHGIENTKKCEFINCEKCCSFYANSKQSNTNYK